MSLRKIATAFNFNCGNVFYWVKRHEIPMRTVREGISASDTFSQSLSTRMLNNQYNLGRKPTPELLAKLRKANTGRRGVWTGIKGEANPNWRGKQIDHTCTNCGKIFTAYKEHRKGKCTFCSAKCRGEYLRGDRSLAWKGGCKDKYPIEFKRLRKSIRDRDNNKCVMCGKTRADNNNQALSVHHIDYNKRNLDGSNLITLCLSCHAKTNYKREDWEIYLTDLLRCNPTKD